MNAFMLQTMPHAPKEMLILPLFIHACKSPCHQDAVGYKGSLHSSHKNYLVLEQEDDLYLNIIDPPIPLFMPPLFSHFLEFAKSRWNSGQKLLIHCNKGESRAPSLALLFLAKGISAIENSSYEAARKEFEVFLGSTIRLHYCVEKMQTGNIPIY